MAVMSDNVSGTGFGSLDFLRFLRERQRDEEGRPPPLRARDGDVATVVFHDPLREGKTKTGALFFRREEGSEDLVYLVVRDSLAVVGNLDVDIVG